MGYNRSRNREQGGENFVQAVMRDGESTMRHNELSEGAGRRTDVLVSPVRGVVLPRTYLLQHVGQQALLLQKARDSQRARVAGSKR
jgi:hypothetical protein